MSSTIGVVSFGFDYAIQRNSMLQGAEGCVHPFVQRNSTSALIRVLVRSRSDLGRFDNDRSIFWSFLCCNLCWELRHVFYSCRDNSFVVSFAHASNRGRRAANNTLGAWLDFVYVLWADCQSDVFIVLCFLASTGCSLSLLRVGTVCFYMFP